MVGPNAASSTVKFLCSYGGKILPRYPDGKLRYHGGHTRVLAVHRSVTFAELLVKMGELCGASVTLRCQFPSEDLDALISITSDEDLTNLIEEYEQTSSSLKIRAFLSPPKKTSPSPSGRSNGSAVVSPPSRPSDRCTQHVSNPLVYQRNAPKKVPLVYQRNAPKKVPLYAYYPQQGSPGHVCLVHSGNHWQ